MTAAALKVLRSGPGNTIQDGGRHGWLKFGITPAGPMDWVMHAVANAMAENPRGTATIEVTIGGIELEVSGGPVTLAYAGPGFVISRNGSPLPACGRVSLATADRLAVKAGPSGTWCYIAPAARFDLVPVMGSLSTHTRSEIGGFEGRMLQSGDLLPFSEVRTVADAGMDPARPESGTRHIRVILGPQDDYFSKRGIAVFLNETFTLASRMDRMAYWLDGPKIEHRKGFNIVSDGIALGSIQVPGNGLPLILMADRQPTGGYPKIATVIRADLPKLAQMRAGARLQFATTDVQTASAALAGAVSSIATTVKLLAPSFRSLQSDLLLATNLVSGVVNAID